MMLLATQAATGLRQAYATEDAAYLVQLPKAMTQTACSLYSGNSAEPSERVHVDQVWDIQA